MGNNGEMRISAKPSKLYVIQKVLMRAVQNVLFIEFEPLCQTLWAFLSNFGIFYDARSINWSCHVTQEANFEIFLFCPNSAFNIRKSNKISSRKALYFRSYQPKTHGGVENTPPPTVPLGLSQIRKVMTHLMKLPILQMTF